MSDRIRNITIVGGGTAGWLTAAMLHAAFNRRAAAPVLGITVIESPSLPTVGVGESTTGHMRWVLEMLQIDEDDFLRHCDGSLKAGVKFVDWDRDPATGAPMSSFQLFDQPVSIAGYFSGYHYVARANRAGVDAKFADLTTVTPALLEACRSPRAIDATPFEGFVPYSYHFDAGLFAAYLRDYCKAVGVRHILDDVIDVRVGEQGHVTGLALRERGEYPIEFIVDCSGFRGIVIRQALEEPFLPYDHHLLCDRAIALQVPQQPGARLEPFTTASALGAGWVWNVPLFTRRGTGYVFASSFRSDDEALKEFLDHLGGDVPDVEPAVIPMRIGRSQRSWVGNCLAIGLSGGFIEPLEATSIHFILAAIRWFIANFPDARIGAPLRDSYNRLVADLYEEIRDFIAMYYCTSNRDDTAFWRAVTNDVEVPDSLAARLEIWRYRMPGTMDLPSPTPMFEDWNYALALLGKNFYDGASFPIEDSLSDDDFETAIAEIRRRQLALLQQAPDNREFLTRIRSRHKTPWYRTGMAASVQEPEPAESTGAIM